jgi:pimeloyl-ACP methyl ester carboxylesterase
VSYGTVQASFYGKMFPEHVSAFVLDSPVYFGDATHVDDIHKAIDAYDNELSRFLDWCSKGDECGLGTTPADVGSNYDTLRADLAEGVVYDGELVTDIVLDSVASSLLMYGEWETLAIVLNQAAHGNLDSLVAAAVADSEDPGADHAMWQANLVVRLLDYGCPTDYTSAEALQQIQDAMATHPRMANVYSWHFTACLGWGTRPSERRIDTRDLKSTPFLLLTSAHDAATPLEGAQSLLAQLNNDSTLVVVEKEGHGVIGIDGYGTTRGVDFVQGLNPSAECSGPECFGLGDLALSSLPASKRPQPKLPLIKPRPFMPIVRL